MHTHKKINQHVLIFCTMLGSVPKPFPLTIYARTEHPQTTAWASCYWASFPPTLGETSHNPLLAVFTHLPFCRISRCSHRMSPTKSGASSRKHSLPRAHNAAPFIQNFWKSTPFRLNSFTAHITQSRTWVSVHCRGSEKRDQMRMG